MASTQEVAVPVGEVVMVKAEAQGDPDDPSKAQVILQLQPISSGDEPAEAGAAIIAVEEGAGQAEREDVEIGCPITCGDCKALLLMKKFVCPGINVKCVKYEDQLISPKQFVHMSGKATLKDWKRAIRMGGVMLRKMMDSGQLDFYQHSSLCTNTCRSTKFDLLINNTRFPPDGTGTGLATPTSSQAQAVQGNGGEDKADAPAGKLDWSSSEACERKEPGQISEDTLAFWKGIADVGLLGEVVSSVRSELLRMLGGVQQQQREAAALQDAEVAVLSNLAQVFGLLDSVKRMVERRKQQTDPSQEQLLSTLTSLEVQLEEQQQQQQAQARLAASCRSKTPSKRASKRPRLQRPASTTTLLSSPVSQPAQFTVLSPISLSSLGQPFSVAGLPLATLAQSPGAVTLLPAGSQVFTRYLVAADGKSDTFTLHPSSGLTLVGGGGVQEPGPLGAVVSPLELVQLSQQPEVVPVDGAVLLQQDVMPAEAEPGQEHTLIQINPAPAEQEVGVMELRLDREAAREQAGVPPEEVQGLQLDAGGQLSTVQILVLGETPPEDHRAKDTQ